MRKGAYGLLAGALLLLGATGAPADHAPGAAWRLVRCGGGLTSPKGTTGMELQGVASNGELYVVVGGAGTIAHSSDGNRLAGGHSGWLRESIGVKRACPCTVTLLRRHGTENAM